MAIDRLWIGFMDIVVRLFLFVALPVARWHGRRKYWRQRRAMLRAAKG